VDSAAVVAAGPPDSDDLNLQRVLLIFFRTWPFIRPSMKHLISFVIISAMVFLIGAGLGLLLIGLATGGIMSAEPMSPLYGWIYGLDPDRFMTVTRLSDEARRELAWPTVNTAIVASVVGVSAGAGLYYCSIWIFQMINQRMRVRLIEQLQAQSLAYHARAQAGDAIYRVYQDSAMVTAIVRAIFLEPLMYIGRYFGGVVIVAAFSPTLALILAVTVLPMIFLGRYFSARLRQRFRHARESNAALTSWIQESIQGIRVIKATGNEGSRESTFEERSGRALGAAFQSRFMLNVFNVLVFVIIGSAILATQGISAVFAHENAATFARDILLTFGFAVWNFSTFAAAGTRMGDAIGSLRALMGTWGRAQDMAMGLGRVFEILDLVPDIVDAPDAVPLVRFEREIRFTDVSFSYLSGRPVLRHIDFVASRGTVTGISGPTGSGKSTLMSLLLRLADPDEGAITLDGVDIRTLTIESLRDSISIATQENVLFSDTVLENILFARPEATREEAIAAARIACAHEFIEKLPMGYDTHLGERSAKLSSGQRQRLVLARAIAKNTPVLILDEPTAALDAQTEIEVLTSLKQWAHDRCVFMITHRASTLREADTRLYLRDGCLVKQAEDGRFVERQGAP
jgi:ABC-type multidrug transport system fused ATPase/permease subunit